jgi:hypothetical protein
LAWITSHNFRKTTATVLDGGDFTAREIADQLGHARPSMTQDVHMGARFETRGRSVPWTPCCANAGTARGALRQLDDEYEHWVDGVRSLGMAGLAQPQGDPPAFAHAPLAKKMLCANVEVIHHGAEICLLRDLYLRNGSGKSQR